MKLTEIVCHLLNFINSQASRCSHLSCPSQKYLITVLTYTVLTNSGINLLETNTADAIHTPTPVIKKIKAITTRIVRELFSLMRSAKREKKINVLQIQLRIWATDCVKLCPTTWSSSSHSEMITYIKDWVHGFWCYIRQNLNESGEFVEWT